MKFWKRKNKRTEDVTGEVRKFLNELHIGVISTEVPTFYTKYGVSDAKGLFFDLPENVTKENFKDYLKDELNAFLNGVDVVYLYEGIFENKRPNQKHGVRISLYFEGIDKILEEYFN